MKGMIFDIQNYALYDGPGIRTCVFLKGCPLRCEWCHNPESIRPEPQMAYARNRCELCGRCVEACPHRALERSNRTDGGRIVRDHTRCARCGTCVSVCVNRAMETIGTEMTAARIVDRVSTDRPFFDRSGGGVTVTGGEPTFQKRFLLDLLQHLRLARIHTAVETCGHFPRSMIGDLEQRADLFLFDLKHLDPVRHRAFTGVDNRLILDNLAAILGSAGPGRITVRIPVIPGFNADSRSVHDLASHLQSIGYHGRVELMEYHGWARTKYERIGRTWSFRAGAKIRQKTRARITRTFARHGLDPVWSGSAQADSPEIENGPLATTSERGGRK